MKLPNIQTTQKIWLFLLCMAHLVSVTPSIAMPSQHCLLRKEPMMPRTKKQQATKIAAERVATILNDPQTPKFLRDVLADMVVSLTNETEANEFHPKVLTTLLEIGLQDATEQG